MAKVTVDVDAKIYKRIMKELPWLSYRSVKDFVEQAVSLRIQDLLHLIAIAKD